MSEKPASYYDDLYPFKASYNDHYKNSHYFVQWVQVEFILREFKQKKILDVGCGTGQFAQFLKDEGYSDYTGVDFSEKAIEIAKTKSDFHFFVGNALDPDLFKPAYDIVMALEVLEHMDNDLDLIKNIPEDTFCLFSIPNFDDPGHVRWFRSEYQVRKRYFKHIDIERIYFIKDIYIFYGRKSTFSPSMLQNFLKTREVVKFSGIMERIRHRWVHFFKIKHT
jgi:SAM-dependent methyltransferase